MDSRGATSHPLDKTLADEPRIITEIKTKYGLFSQLRWVSCVSDEEFWVCGSDQLIRLYNIRGELLKTIETMSGNMPEDIVVTKSGDLVYADKNARTIDILMENTQVQTLITLQEWEPISVCCTFSGDLLVVMNSDDKQTKVVRYSGSTEKQSIQYDDKGQPLYSYGGAKCISENRNLDICVSDFLANAVVVVNQAGKFRFTYNGSPSTNKDSFRPISITTDSQSLILISDIFNDCIHILDQYGEFLRFIDNCRLLNQCYLSVDTRDNLFVAQSVTCRVKIIQYYI